jgi:hypothetical protein
MRNQLLIGAAALGLVLVGIGLFLMLRNRTAERHQAEEPVAAGVSAQGDASSIMDAILTLDDLYKAGDLPEDAYHERRDELKQRLRTALDQSG